MGEAARNDITGQVIKSRAITQDWLSNWDKAFKKQSANEWMDFLYPNKEVILLDPDGWRQNDGITLESKISLKEFNERMSLSTCMMNNLSA